MNKTKIKKETRKLLRRIDRSPSLSRLQDLPEYNIHYYNGKNLSGDEILQSIRETDYAKTVNSFSIERNGKKIIFIKDSISYEERVFLILHEIGHLVLGHHKNQDTYYALTLEQEQEANFFAESICKYDKNKLIKRNILLTSILTGFVLIGSVYFLINHIDHTTTAKIDNTECFITATGRRYHMGCDYLKDNEGVTWLTIKEAKENDYTPCKSCVPEEYR